MAVVAVSVYILKSFSNSWTTLELYHFASQWKIDTSAISFEDLENELFSDAMFGLRKSTELEVPPCPPTAEEIIEDLEKAGPDDVVFTTEINATDLDPLPNTFNLTKRFQVCVFCLFSVFMFRKT